MESCPQDLNPRNFARQFFYPWKVACGILPAGKFPTETCMWKFTRRYFAHGNLPVEFYPPESSPRKVARGSLPAGKFPAESCPPKVLRGMFPAGSLPAESCPPEYCPPEYCPPEYCPRKVARQSCTIILKGRENIFNILHTFFTSRDFDLGFRYWSKWPNSQCMALILFYLYQ